MIRLLTPGEIPPWELLLEADPNQEFVAAYIKNGKVLIFEQDGVKGVIVYQKNNHEYEIMNLAVKKSARRKGIAEKLLQTACQQIKAAGATEVTIKTGANPSGALNLYLKTGFKKSRIVKDYFLTHYPEKIYENGKLLRDQLVLVKKL